MSRQFSANPEAVSNISPQPQNPMDRRRRRGILDGRHSGHGRDDSGRPRRGPGGTARGDGGESRWMRVIWSVTAGHYLAPRAGSRLAASASSRSRPSVPFQLTATVTGTKMSATRGRTAIVRYTSQQAVVRSVSPTSPPRFLKDG